MSIKEILYKLFNSQKYKELKYLKKTKKNFQYLKIIMKKRLFS